MQVFLSWSGRRSKLVAQALNELLPGILQPIRCWMSEADLPKGKPWFDQLASALSTITFAIVCVTKENRHSPWLLWEAGFLSSPTALGDRRVAPLAVGIAAGSLDGPLSIYQSTETSRDEALRLVRSINEALPADVRIQDSTLSTTFEWGWPRLQARLKAAIEVEVDEKPVPQVTEQSQISEILAILRQQQREVSEVRQENEALKSELRDNKAINSDVMFMFESERRKASALQSQLAELRATAVAAARAARIGQHVPLSTLMHPDRESPSGEAATGTSADADTPLPLRTAPPSGS